jgi:hypothetical protein
MKLETQEKERRQKQLSKLTLQKGAKSNLMQWRNIAGTNMKPVGCVMLRHPLCCFSILVLSSMLG